MPKPVDSNTLEILYDGDCPFCQSYVRVVRLRDNFNVRLLNAREHPDLVALHRLNEIEISDGFIVTLNGQAYHGSQALSVLSSLTSSSGMANRLMAKLFQSPARTRLLYPVMKLGRRLTMALLGRKARIE